MANADTLVRLYTDYRKLIEDCRTLEYIREMIQLRKDLTVTITSDFVGIINIVEQYPSSDPIHKRITDILDIELGIQGILEYNDNVVTGSNLSMVSRLDEVEKDTLWSNSIRQVEERFGIEAARELIFGELKASCDNPGIIADYMTWHGSVHPLNKGILDNKGVLSSMAFERPKQDMNKLSNGSVEDDVSSVYSQIMTGSDCLLGTRNPSMEVF
ncbi:hypothetical protein K439DRAFT_1615756 [Ramaria rubella]|nr:hypothetical protein K439DRAFT_1615756 [Ramaria rubella]